ncbi:MAG: efflux RND transporter permease subunit [Lentisphaerae bacterium]|nr:efflux RND transporter permease subunit [Lentisphaerota bacterium]
MFSQIFIERPKLAMVISIVTVIAGLLCLSKAPIAEYPEIAPPTIMVMATYTGASSQELADTVATVIEEQCNGLENLLYFSSTCNNTGMYLLEITFASGSNTDINLVNVQNAVKRAEPLLPEIVKRNGVRQFKRSGDILALYNFTTDGSEMSLTELSNFIRTNVRDPLSRVPGISEVSIMGERNYSMRLWLNSAKMANLGISVSDVSAAVQSQNVQAAAGAIGSEGSSDFLQLKVTTLGRLHTVEQFENIVVRAKENGEQVKVKDIARVELGAESYSNGSRFNGQDAISLMIYRNTDANALEVVEKANALLEELKATQFPKGVDYQIGYDPTEYIRITMAEIFETLILTLILVVAITYLFLQDWRATLVPAITIPVSLIGTFIFLIPLGFSINLLTMFGLILVIGSLVDDAIVVTENCMRIIEEEGLSPKEAASKSMKQITGAVIATTLVIVAIYVPVGFYGGMVGTIYLQFSVTMCISLCLSTINALTLSPALCALLLRKPKAHKIFNGFNMFLSGSCAGYMKLSRFLVRYTIIAVVIFAGVIYMNYHYLKTIPSSFIPGEDKGAVMGMIDLRPGATLKETDAVLRQVDEKIKDIPGVENSISIYGFNFVSGAGENAGTFIVTLDEWEKRTTPETQINAIHAKMQQIGMQIPEARVNFFQPPAIMGLGVTGGVTFMLQANAGQTPQELHSAMNKMLMRLNSSPNVMMAFGSFETGTPELFIDIDREKAEALGVPVNRVFSVLSGNVASDYINDFNLKGYSFKVKMQSENSERTDANELLQLMVPSNRGAMVPLSSFASVRRTSGSRTLTRFNQLLAAKITVQGNPGISSQLVMKEIEQIMKEDFPRGYQISWTDMSYQERGNEGRIVQLLILALVFGYLFLVGQYESWTIPISVVLSFFFAMVGGFMGMKYSGLDFSIYAQLGIVMLIGLACKNAILMVEFSKQEREAGKSVEEAAQNGFKHRYRAVLMTAWSFVIGVFPMVIATGAGAGSRRAIGITTFYGMLLSTIIGIVFIPPLYAFFQRGRERVYGWFGKNSEPQAKHVQLDLPPKNNESGENQG